MLTESEKAHIAMVALEKIVNHHVFRWSHAAAIAAEALERIARDGKDDTDINRTEVSE